MIKFIKSFFKKKEEASDKAWKESTDSYLYGNAAHVIFEIAGAVHKGSTYCEKCEHLLGKQFSKEMFDELLTVHGIKIVVLNDSKL